LKGLFILRAFVMVALVAACTPRGVIVFAPEAETVGKIQRIHFSTTRERDPRALFGPGRSPRPTYGMFELSIPPAHRPGRIEWPRGRPDPAHDFLATAAVLYPSRKAFIAGLRKDLHALPRGEREAVIYIHGFNNNFAEGLYRMAQMKQDFGLPGVAIHYSWPSAGNPFGYGYDRDSMLFARDGLEDLIEAAELAGSERILLVGHSMGSLLLMETLRQMEIGRRHHLVQRIGGVVLISPDIDLDLFRQQVRRISRLPQPFLIFTSRRDRALRLSAAITGQKERLGSVSDVRALAELKVTLFDVSKFTKGLVGHFTPATSPALIRILANIRELDAALQHGRPARPGLLPGTILTVRNATQIILTPMAAASP